MENRDRNNMNPLWAPGGSLGNTSQTNSGPLWNPECTPDNKPLRKPVSNLRPEAKEYIPTQRYKLVEMQPTKSNRSSAQDRLSKLKLNNDDLNDVGKDFHELQGLIVSVTNVPGQFEDLIDTIMCTFERYTENDSMVNDIALFIFNQAVNEPSFRYNGARLCALIEDMCPIFGNYLQNFCKNEAFNNVSRPGFTLFLAELCVQINAEYSADNLYLSINKLLSHGGDDNVKAVCQTLKLSGCVLECYNKEQMEIVLKKLEGVKPTVKDNIKHLMESVFTLRQNNWGQDSSVAASSSYSTPNTSYNNFNNSTNYFDGQDYFDNLDDPDELYDPEPEMDEEIQLAFREFVKLSK